MEPENAKENQPPPAEKNTGEMKHYEERGGSDKGWLTARKPNRYTYRFKRTYVMCHTRRTFL